MKDTYTEQELIRQGILATAERMVIAARTAPKAKGKNRIHSLVVMGEDKQRLAERMEATGRSAGQDFFLRDAENVRQATAVVLLGCSIKATNLAYCGFCGFENCDGKRMHPESPCAFNTIDLGIAAGSAAGVAMDSRVDNRIMYTAGIAALEMGLLGDDVKIALGIPLAATSKNIFFDRG